MRIKWDNACKVLGTDRFTGRKLLVWSKEKNRAMVVFKALGFMLNLHCCIFNKTSSNTTWLSDINKINTNKCISHLGTMGLSLKSFLLKKKVYFSFIFGCAGSSLLCGIVSSSSIWGLFYSCGMQTSHYSSVSCHRAWALQSAGFSSCSMWAQQLPFPGSRAQAQ